MKTENSLTFEDYISPIIHIIIKNETEIITNKIYPKTLSLKSILISEGLPIDINYTIQKSVIDINKPLIDLISKNIEELTDLELIIESEDILDISENKQNKLNNPDIQYKILRPYQKPFRILCFNSQENNVSIKKYEKQTLEFFGLKDFVLSKSSYCNSFNDLYISHGENKNFYKINNIKLNIEKLDDIPWEKKYHSMIYIPKKYIYFIGGNSRVTFHYDFINKVFKVWSPMKYIEKYPGLVYVNKTYIYAFGHPKKLDDFNFIERTNIRKKPKWDVINCKLSEPFNLKRFACILSNDEKIYFVGGKEAKNDRIFFFDLKSNEISKTSQINSFIRINESNFYDINEFTSVLLPQETNGDIKFIAFNHRTKKFRKLRFERDYDITSESNILELNHNETNNENMKITAEVNFKKLENKFEKEKTRNVDNPREDDLQIPNLSEIKKLLLGNKNILNKNVEAMIFNRKRIKNKISDKIDGDDSENEYQNIRDFDEDENNLFNEEKIENDIEEENNEKNDNIKLRAVPRQKINAMNKGEYLRDIFSQDVDKDIDILKVKNPKITIEDYKNLMFLNRITSSYIPTKITNSTNNTLEIMNGLRESKTSPFKSYNENRYYFDLTGKKKNLSNIGNKPENVNNENIDDNSNKNINKDINEIKKKINNNIDGSKEKINEEINDNKPNLNINNKSPTAQTPENDLNNLNKNKTYNLQNSTNSDYILNATIKGKMTSIVGEKNFGILKANDTKKSLTLKELFGGSVDDKIILNQGNVIVPKSEINSQEKKESNEIKDDKDIINIKPKNELITGVIEGTNIKKSINISQIDLKKPEIEIEAKVPENDVNIIKTKLEQKEDIKSFNIPNKTLKEIFGDHIDNNIELNIVKSNLWPLEIQNKDIPRINFEKPEFDEQNKLKNELALTGRISDLGNAEISIYTEIKPIFTLKEEFGKNVDDNIYINIPKNELYSNEVFLNQADKKDRSLKNSQNIEIDLPDVILPDINLRGNKPEININGKNPKVNINIKNPIINASLNGSKPELDISLKKSGKNNDFIPAVTLKDIFNEDIEAPYNLNIKKHKLEPDLDFIIPHKKTENLNPMDDITIEVPKLNMNINRGNIDTKIPKFENIEGEIPGKNINKPKYELIKGEIPGTIEVGKKSKSKIKKPDLGTDITIKNPNISPDVTIPQIKVKKPEVDINVKNPKVDFNVKKPEVDIKMKKPIINLDENDTKKITLQQLFSKDINDKIDLKVIKPDLWDIDNYNSSGLINGKNININIPSGNIDIKSLDINIPQFNLNGSIDNTNINKEIKGKISGKIPGIEFNKPDIDIENPNIEVNKPELDIKKPNLHINRSKPNLDVNFKNEYGSLITLKEFCSKEINDNINLNVINPELWGNEFDNYNSTGIINGKMNINLPSADISIKKPDIEIPNINPNLNLKTDINKQNLDINIDDDSIPSLDINTPEINNDIKLRGPKVDVKVNKPKIDFNAKKPKIDLSVKNEKNKNSETLKDLFGQNINDKIILKVINPKLWGNDELTYKKNRKINRSMILKYPKRNVDMNDPNIDNILNYSLKASINKPDVDTNIKIGGKMPNMSMNIPKTTDIKKPKIHLNIKKPDLDIKLGKIKFGNDKDKDNKNKITLKQLFSGDIDENINLNVINPKLWGNDIYDSSGLINGKTNINLPTTNINIKNPNIKIPDYDININNKQNISIEGDIPEIKINDSNIKTNLRAPNIKTNIKKPDINIEGIKFGNQKINQDNKNITLKDLFNNEIDDDIYLKVIKPELWDLDNYNSSDLIDGNLRFNLPKGNFNINSPNINLPNLSIKGKVNKPKIENNINPDLSSSIPSLKIKEPNINIKPPTKDINIDIKKPDLNSNLRGIEFDSTNKEKEKEERLSETLKQICNKDIDDDIQLKVIYPPLWDIDDHNLSGYIKADNNFNINLPKGEITISKPELNIPDINIGKGNMNSHIKGDIPGINLEVKKPEIDNNININGKIPGFKKPEIDNNINISGKIPGFKKPGIDIDNTFKSLITLRDEFGKDVDDNIFNLKIPKNELSPDFSNIEADINIPDIKINLPKSQLKGVKGQFPGLNLGNSQSNINVQLPTADINFKTNTIKPSRNTKKFVEEIITGEIPGINIKKSRTEMITGEIPGTKVKKSGTIDIKKPKVNEDLNINLSGIIPGKEIKKPEIDLNVKKPKIETNITGPNIKIDKDLPDFDYGDFYSNDNINVKDIPLKQRINLKEIFSGDVNDKDINLNVVKQDLWENEIFNPFNSSDTDINIQLPEVNGNIENPDINIPEIEIPEISSDLKIKDPKFNPNINANIKIPELINKDDIRLEIPELNADIKGEIKSEIPGIKVDKKFEGNKINNNIPIYDNEDSREELPEDFEILENENDPPKTLKEKFSQDIAYKIIPLKIKKNEITPDIENLDLNKNKNAPPLNCDFNIDIENKSPEIDVPNITLKGIKTNLSSRNKIKFNDKKDNLDIPDININKGGIDLKVNLPEKNRVDELKKNLTLKDLFSEEIDNDDYFDLNVVNPVLIPHNNTLYISGEKDKIKVYPADSLSIKGPNKKNLLNKFDNKSEISDNFSNQSQIVESDIKHNIPNDFDNKIKLGREQAKIKSEIITLKELFSGDINDDINLKLLKKNPHFDANTKEEYNFEPSNCDENVGENIIPINIDVKYSMPTYSNNINNISPSKKENASNKFQKRITLKELFNMDVNAPFNLINTHVDYEKGNMNLKQDEEEPKEEDDFNFPSEDDIKSLNSITSGLMKKNKNKENKDNNKLEEQGKKDDSWDFDDLV